MQLSFCTSQCFYLAPRIIPPEIQAQPWKTVRNKQRGEFFLSDRELVFVLSDLRRFILSGNKAGNKIVKIVKQDGLTVWLQPQHMVQADDDGRAGYVPSTLLCLPWLNPGIFRPVPGYLHKSDSEQEGSSGSRELAGCSAFGSGHLGVRKLRHQLCLLCEPSVDSARVTWKKKVWRW